MSVKQFALQYGLHPSTVYAVLNGQKKCLRGDAHRAAVLLGIKKDGMITTEGRSPDLPQQATP